MVKNKIKLILLAVLFFGLVLNPGLVDATGESIEAEDLEVPLLEYDLQNQAFAEGAGFEKNPQDPRRILSLIIEVMLSLLAIGLTALLVYSGYLLMTSRGDEEKVKKGRKTATSALVGLVLVLGAWSLTKFIFFIVSGDAEHRGSYTESGFRPDESPQVDPLGPGPVEEPRCLWCFW